MTYTGMPVYRHCCYCDWSRQLSHDRSPQVGRDRSRLGVQPEGLEPPEGLVMVLRTPQTEKVEWAVPCVIPARRYRRCLRYQRPPPITLPAAEMPLGIPLLKSARLRLAFACTETNHSMVRAGVRCKCEMRVGAVSGGCSRLRAVDVVHGVVEPAFCSARS